MKAKRQRHQPAFNAKVGTDQGAQFTYGTVDSPTLLFFPTNTYQIFAFCDEARCFALGAQPNVGGVFLTSLQLELDNPPFNYGTAHKYHSAQFRTDNLDRANFWKTLLQEMRLKH